MRVAMLGPLRLVAEDGSAIDLGGARLRMLLARLALEPGQVVGTDALIDGLWGEAPPSDATNALQSLVSRLRRSLRSENGTLVESHPAGYRLAVARDDVDVHRFERLAAQGREQLRAGDAGAAAATLRAALDLWRGPAMADVAEAPFAGAPATRLAELHAAAVEDRVESDLRLGRHQEVLAELRALVDEQPLRERRSALLIKALYLAGRQAEALAAYETVRRALADELGVEPSEELARVHLAVLRRDPELVPARPDTLPGKGNSLPARLTSFVGRQGELREVADRLTASRLVTLVGPGGAGKTRLATETAATLPGPARFIELAGVGESADVAAAVLTALGLREVRMLESRPVTPADPVDRLVEALAGQQTVIVLDNCEHVITAAARLADTLLAHCPGLRILATSREPLAITGEAVFPVGPLEPAEAVRLFVDRAASARPGFALDDENSLVVKEICRRLDGLPLALELAAARLRSMTVGQIAERLDDRFRLLTAGSRTSMPRHRTLRAVVEWSWDLLEKPERVLARRLAVFASGATLESATAVCADDELPAEDVLYVLSSLVEKSLVEAGTGGDGQPRYRMLETVRVYAAGRLAEAGDIERVQARFARYFLELAEKTEPLLRGADQVVWLARLNAERDNIQAVIRHAIDIGDADTAIRLSMAIAWFGALSGWQRDGIALARQVSKMPGQAPPHTRATLKVIASIGEGLPELDVLTGVREELAGTGAMRHFPLLAMIEPLLALLVGDLPAMEDAIRRGREHPDPWGRAAAQLGRAFLADNEGRPQDVEREASEALAAFRALGDRWGQAMALGQLAERQSLSGDHAGAIAGYEESLRLVSELGAYDDLPELLARLAAQRARAGDLDGADRDLLIALDAARERGATAAEAFVRCGQANVLRLRGELTGATEHLERATDVLATLPRPEAHWRSFYERTRAAIAVAEGRLEDARAALCRGYEAMLQFPDLPVLAMLAEGAAQLVASRRDAAGAARLIGMATALRGTPDLGDVELTALVGRLMTELGGPDYAKAYEAGAGLSRDDAKAELRGVVGSTMDGGSPSR